MAKAAGGLNFRSTSTYAGGGGANGFTYTAKTSGYTAVANDFINCTSGTFSVTLPTASGIAGQSIAIKNTGTGVITILTTSAQTIDGLASGIFKMYTKYDSIIVVSDGANWMIDVYNVNHSVSYGTAAAQSITNTSTFTIVNYGTVNWDYTGNVTTGSSWVFTCTIPGTYEVFACNTTAAEAYAGGNVINITLFKGGSPEKSLSQWPCQFAATNNICLNGAASVKLAAADTINVKLFNNRSAGNLNLLNDANYNYIMIRRTGN